MFIYKIHSVCIILKVPKLYEWLQSSLIFCCRGEIYGNDQYEAQNQYDQQQQQLYEQQHVQYEAQIQQQNPVNTFDQTQPPQYERPVTPIHLRGRITRSRLRSKYGTD